jgi:hypothetical protein
MSASYLLLLIIGIGVALLFWMFVLVYHSPFAASNHIDLCSRAVLLCSKEKP